MYPYLLCTADTVRLSLQCTLQLKYASPFPTGRTTHYNNRRRLACTMYVRVHRIPNSQRIVWDTRDRLADPVPINRLSIWILIPRSPTCNSRFQRKSAIAMYAINLVTNR